MKILLTILILLHLFIINNFAKCYFISRTGGDDNFTGLAPIRRSNNTGTFLTLARAVRVVQPGYTVFVRNGVLHENAKLKSSGFAKSPIIVQNNLDEYPTNTFSTSANAPVMDMIHFPTFMCPVSFLWIPRKSVKPFL